MLTIKMKIQNCLLMKGKSIAGELLPVTGV